MEPFSVPGPEGKRRSTTPSLLPRNSDGRGRIAVTLGDPRGIGPEVMPKAVEAVLAHAAPESFLVIGPDGLDPGLAPYLPVGGWDGTLESAGRVTLEAIRRGAELGLEGAVGGLVTGPSHKPALRAAGWEGPGQTELLAALTGTEEVGMLMDAEETALGSPLRVLLATTHLPLRSLFERLDTDLLIRQCRLLARALTTDWGFPDPRIGLCALNPHAGDEGLFGREEAELFAPAVRALTAEGVRITGPVPADTVFRRALDGEFDAVVAPYHDVGMAAFKAVAFGRGVNVTLGLPFVRTSPDHGTAFDLAGTGRADPASAEAALRLALRLVRARFDTPRPAP